MTEFSQFIGIATFLSFVPICIHSYRKQAEGSIYWLLLACPLVASLLYCSIRISHGWHTDFISSLWVSIATGLILFVGISINSKNMRQLTILFLPYMALFAFSATLWNFVITNNFNTNNLKSAETPWLILHIVSSLLTYALLTLAATAALAVYLREWALKTKRKSNLIDKLPSMADSERLQVRLMIVSEMILGAGLMSGLATEIMQGGNWFYIDHKIILSFIAFIILGGLLIAHYKSGIRGQKAARILLLCYLLITMGFPGVKFITDVLIGS